MVDVDKKTKVLVTGAKGQLGKKIIEVMEPKYELVLTDVDTMDITNAAMVDAMIEKEKPDYIIHGAAYTRVDAAEENKELCRKINVLGTENVAKAAKDNDATLIYISTDYVFDGQKTIAYAETDEPKPLSVYGLTKYEGELAVAKYSPKHYIIRSAWIFGELPEGHPGTNFVETMLKLAKERDSLSIVNDQIGSPTYTGDLVDIISSVVSRQSSVKRPATNDLRQTTCDLLSYGLYHFSGTGACSWYDFAREIFKQSGIEIEVKPITSKEYPQKAKRPAYSYMDKTKIEQALGIKVRPWQEMLAEYLDKRA